MITAEKLAIAVQERLKQLNETPESMVEQAKAEFEDERFIADASLLRAAVDQRLPTVDYATVRALERALGYSEFTLFAFSADGRGLPEFGEDYG